MRQSIAAGRAWAAVVTHGLCMATTACLITQGQGGNDIDG
jgi:hypothetical protein